MDSLLALTSQPIPLHGFRPPWPLSPRTTVSFASSVTISPPSPNLIHLRLPCRAFPMFAMKRGSESEEPALQPSNIDELEDVEDENDFIDDEDDGLDDEYLEDEEPETRAGDGAGGGGIALAGTWWDKEALTLAQQVSDSFDGQLSIYAFRTLANSTVQLRIENTGIKSGSPTISDIEAFSRAYRELLDKAEQSKAVPDNITLEVSSPGVERVVRIPQDLDRFKERSMLVKYVSGVDASGLSTEGEGVFKLISYDVENRSCIWGLADVRINREKAGKGRPMNKKQREWRLFTSFDSLLLVRLYSEP